MNLIQRVIYIIDIYIYIHIYIYIYTKYYAYWLLHLVHAAGEV